MLVHVLLPIFLPISDWQSRLLGKRPTTPSSRFQHQGECGHEVPVYHRSSDPTHLTCSKNPASSPLQSLPPELRLRIFQFLFHDVKSEDWLRCHFNATPASVVFACKLFYEEARELALRGCTFCYEDLPERYQIMAKECDGLCESTDTQ